MTPCAQAGREVAGTADVQDASSSLHTWQWFAAAPLRGVCAQCHAGPHSTHAPREGPPPPTTCTVCSTWCSSPLPAHKQQTPHRSAIPRRPVRRSPHRGGLEACVAPLPEPNICYMGWTSSRRTIICTPSADPRGISTQVI